MFDSPSSKAPNISVQENYPQLQPASLDKPIDSSPNVQLQSVDLSTYGGLPIEIWINILRLLPAYSFFEDQNVHLVSRLFNSKPFKTDETIKSKKNWAALIESCKTEEDAINILSNATLVDKLSSKKLLTVIGACPDLAVSLLEKCKEIPDANLNISELIALGTLNAKTAQKVIEYHPTGYATNSFHTLLRIHPECRSQLDNCTFDEIDSANQDIFVFKTRSMIIAQVYLADYLNLAFLPTYTGLNQLDLYIWQLATLAPSLVKENKITQIILQTPERLKSLHPVCLLVLCGLDVNFARFVFEDKILLEKCLDFLKEKIDYFIPAFIKHDIQFAYEVLNDAKVKEFLEEGDSDSFKLQMAVCFPEWLKTYLQEHAKDLDEYSLKYICVQNENAALTVLQDESHKQKISAFTLEPLILKFKSVGLFILKDPQLKSRLNYRLLIGFSQYPREVFNVINNDPSLLHEMWKVPPIAFAIAYKEVAKQLFCLNEHLDKLTLSDIVLIASKHEEIASQVLDPSSVLATKMGPDAVKKYLCTLIRKHPTLICQVLDRPELCKHLDNDSLIYELCSIHISVARKVWNTPELVQKLSSTHVDFLKKKILIYSIKDTMIPQNKALLFSKKAEPSTAMMKTNSNELKTIKLQTRIAKRKLSK